MQPVGAHLVGSVPLANAEEVFRTVGSILGKWLRRIPDGETGVRRNWIGWQHQIFASHPMLEISEPEPGAYVMHERYRLRSSVAPSELRFGRLGYAAAARDSYTAFALVKRNGGVPPATRFQVSLPTPLAPIVSFVTPRDRETVEREYERALLAELDQITNGVPAGELAIQWDTALEFALLEGLMPSGLPDVKAGILERLIRLGDRVPTAVELGYHLCYGDSGHKHFKEPEDTSTLVELANAVSAGVRRDINWIHMPVPRNRTQDAYFAPLRGLKLRPKTDLYLGLVHLTDGIEGTLQRIAAAQAAVSQFGVATECGFGRRPPETIPELLKIHAAVAQPL